MAPFTIDISVEQLDDLKSRLRRTRFPDEVEGAKWDYGTNLEFLRKLVHHWRDEYDWKREQDRLNSFPQFMTEIDGEQVHFVHARGRGKNSIPILLANGWPSNFVELLPVVERLGRTEGGSFSVVVPSLPGYGFSGKPRQRGMNLTRMAHLWAKLMHELGYARFLISSSDMGSGIAVGLLRHCPDRLLGAHWCNVWSGFARPEDPTPEEREYFQRVDGWTFSEGGYFMEQGTKPTTLAVGLNDLPAGLASWIVEKFHSWGDTGGNIESRFSLDTLCTILSVYWFTETIGSSMRLYKEAMQDFEFRNPLPKHNVKQAVFVPAAGDPPPPRAWADRHVQNLVRWTEIGRGGHFPALEIPDEFTADIQGFALELEQSS